MPDSASERARPSDHRPSDHAVIEFLSNHHGATPEDLELLSGGFWSAAYGYRIGDDELVLRISDAADGFRSDQRAMIYASAAIPVPEVLAIGEGFDRWFAVSRRHRGRFLEEIPPSEAGRLRPAVVDLLAALRAVPDPGGESHDWHDWLVAGITDVPGQYTSGWRDRLAAADTAAEQTFEACDRRIRSLLDACPDRRQLVHADLLHYNVLVSPSADAVTAVFSWKCSTWGDALYDLAWCTFWGRWHDGIGALDLRNHVLPTLSPADVVDATERLHTYELHIGASHLGWYASTGDHESLRWTAAQLDEILERGI